MQYSRPLLKTLYIQVYFSCPICMSMYPETCFPYYLLIGSLPFRYAHEKFNKHIYIYKQTSQLVSLFSAQFLLIILLCQWTLCLTNTFKLLKMLSCIPNVDKGCFWSWKEDRNNVISNILLSCTSRKRLYMVLLIKTQRILLQTFLQYTNLFPFDISHFIEIALL
jgi:hypothetical protein